MEKIVEQTLLYDFYGSFLRNVSSRFTKASSWRIFSLSEVAEDLGISRQGVHDMIRRCNHILEGYEENSTWWRNFSGSGNRSTGSSR